MKPSDLPRLYRAALTYHPEIGTFRSGRGAWRVADCYERGFGYFPIIVSRSREDGAALRMDVPKKLRLNTFVNPTKLLREILEQQREIKC